MVTLYVYYTAVDLSHVKSSYRCPSESPGSLQLSVQGRECCPRCRQINDSVCKFLVYLPIIPPSPLTPLPVELIDRAIISPFYRRRNGCRALIFLLNYFQLRSACRRSEKPMSTIIGQCEKISLETRLCVFLLRMFYIYDK